MSATATMGQTIGGALISEHGLDHLQSAGLGPTASPGLEPGALGTRGAADWRIRTPRRRELAPEATSAPSGVWVAVGLALAFDRSMAIVGGRHDLPIIAALAAGLFGRGDVPRFGRAGTAGDATRVPRRVDRVGRQHRLAHQARSDRRAAAGRTAGPARRRAEAEPERGHPPGPAGLRRAVCVPLRAVERVSLRSHGPGAFAEVGPAPVRLRRGPCPGTGAACLGESLPRPLSRGTVAGLGRPREPDASGMGGELRQLSVARSRIAGGPRMVAPGDRRHRAPI